MRTWAVWMILLVFVFVLTGCDWTKEEYPMSNVTVVTYNIHHGVNLNGVYDLESIKVTIAATGAEIVALQELDQSWGPRSHFDRQLDWLAKELGMYSVFAPALKNTYGEYGVGILSKYPIVSTESYLLSGQLEQRVLLIVGVKINDRILYINTTHLGLSAKDREEQVKEIIKYTAKNREKENLLLGDFNVGGIESELAPLYNHFYRLKTFDGGDLPETLIGNRATIDHIFASFSITASRFEIVPQTTSDHYPVFATLQILWQDENPKNLSK